MYTIPEAEGSNPPAWATEHVGLVRSKIATWHEQHGRCCYCQKNTWLAPFVKKGKKERQATAEHFIPKSHGGSNFYENIVTACQQCNNERATMDALEYWELHQDPDKLKAWRKTRAEQSAELRRQASKRQKKRYQKRLSEDANYSKLTQSAFLSAVDNLDITLWDAHNIIRSTPWNNHLCLLLKSCPHSRGGTASTAPSSKSLRSKIVLWLFTNLTSRCQLVTTSRSTSGLMVSTS